MRDIVIFDLDGTLFNIEHRRHYVERPKGQKDWTKFTEECVDDTFNEPVRDLLWDLQMNGKLIYLFSGRWEGTKADNMKYREITKKLLADGGVCYDDLRMRPHWNHIGDDILKKNMVKDILDRVAFTVDDRDKVVAMWRSLGLTCFQCAPGDF